MDSDERIGHGPDDMGDDEQEFEVSEYEQYIEDPPEDLVISEDDDERRRSSPRTGRPGIPADATEPEVPDDVPAEDAAIHEIPGT